MRREPGQAGFTLVELLVSLGVMMFVLGATFTALEVFQRNTVADQSRNEQQDAARNTIDRMTTELRSAASLCGTQSGVSCTGTAIGALQRWTAYDIIFQTVDSSTVYGSGNPANQEWVRYCLDASAPASETLWREVLTWTTSTPPSMPSTASCPGTGTAAGQWPAAPSAYKLLTNLTNENGGQNRPLFNFYTPNGLSTPKSMDIDLFIDLPPATANPGETELRAGVDLRNSLGTPQSTFTVTRVGGNVLLDASPSTDPNGQALSFAWYRASGTGALSCPLTGTAIATTPQYNAGALSGTNTYGLVVTDSAGLNSCSTQNF